jgi:hypothetical protein
MILVPSPEIVTLLKLGPLFFEVQVVPESLETQIALVLAAAIFVPSLDIAIDLQSEDEVFNSVVVKVDVVAASATLGKIKLLNNMVIIRIGLKKFILLILRTKTPFVHSRRKLINVQNYLGQTLPKPAKRRIP